MLKALIFDLDDTLYYEREYLLCGYKEVALYLSRKYKCDFKYLYERMYAILKEQGRKKLFDRVCMENNINEDIDNLVEVYRNTSPDLHLCNDVFDILNFKKKYKIFYGIITDGCSKVQWNKIKALGLKKHFDKIIVTDDYGVKYRKPNVYSYNIILNSFNLKAEDSIYIGDNPYKDFLGAREIGMKTIRIKRKYGEYFMDQLDEYHEADYTVQNFYELIHYLNCIYD